MKWLTDLLSPDVSTVLATSAFLVQQQVAVDPWAKVGQIGLGALLALYIVVQVLERILPYLKKESVVSDSKKSASDSIRFDPAVVRYMAALGDLHKKVSDLHDWHNVRGPTGMHVWWAPVDTLSSIVECQRDIQRELRELRDRVEELGPSS